MKVKPITLVVPLNSDYVKRLFFCVKPFETKDDFISLHYLRSNTLCETDTLDGIDIKGNYWYGVGDL